MDFFIRPIDTADPKVVKFISHKWRLFAVFDSDGDLIATIGRNTDSRTPYYMDMEMRFNYTFQIKHVHREWHVMKSINGYFTKKDIQDKIDEHGEFIYNVVLQEKGRKEIGRVVAQKPKEVEVPYVDDEQKFIEGEKVVLTVEATKRSAVARKKCLEIHGYLCKVCGFDFEKTYGEIGKNFIEVHHIESVTTLAEKEGYAGTNPERDLVPVCSNCHSMLHRRRPALLPDELRETMN